LTIHGIGTDIVRIARMEEDLRRYGERFAERILAHSELEEYRASRMPGRFLAKRFAAKEAAVKALGTGFSQGVSLHDVAVAHESGGRPYLIYDGNASRLCREYGITVSHLSIADEAEYAVAFVTLMNG
jgi:holo-[acyl-carrier protein] synthase